jgi:hypothetical protein
MKIRPAAFGTFQRPAGAERLTPAASAGLAFEYPLSGHQFEIAPLDVDGFSVDQGVGHGAPCFLKDSAESGSGYPHLTAAFLMGKIEKIRQPERFTFVDGQSYFIEIHHRNSPGLKVTDIRIESDDSLFLWSHRASILGFFSKTNIRLASPMSMLTSGTNRVFCGYTMMPITPSV